MQIFLVRHGETFWNKRGLIQGNVDVGLNQRGRTQAESLRANFPEDKTFDLATSPLRRARETAAVFKPDLRVQNHWVMNGLRELDQGYWNGLAGEKVASSLAPDSYHQWSADPVSNCPPAGENLSVVKERVNEVLDFLSSRVENPLIIVAHKVVNSIVGHLAGKWELSEVLDSLPDNAALLEVEITR